MFSYGQHSKCADLLNNYDIVFYVRIPFVGSIKNELSQIMVNVEAQKDISGSYDILDRDIFYVCRLVSSQKERDFVNIMRSRWDKNKKKKGLKLDMLIMLRAFYMMLGSKAFTPLMLTEKEMNDTIKP